MPNSLKAPFQPRHNLPQKFKRHIWIQIHSVSENIQFKEQIDTNLWFKMLLAQLLRENAFLSLIS